MTIREKTREINRLAAIADRKARVMTGLREKMEAAETEYYGAVEEWRMAMAETNPLLAGNGVHPAAGEPEDTEENGEETAA